MRWLFSSSYAPRNNPHGVDSRRWQARSSIARPISEKDYARRGARRALASDSRIRLTMTLALPQFVQRSRLTKEAIGAVELTPKRASAASSKMPS
jgi:hypothetical protein